MRRLVTGALRPGQELLDRPIIGGSCVRVADRDRKKLEELFAGRWPGALDDGWSCERIYGNDCRFQLNRGLFI
jgi:hypothetical protein